MRHDQIIDRLGGDVVLGERLGRHKLTVWRWRENGIPYKVFPDIIDLAREVGLRVTLEQLTVTNPRFGQRERAILRRSKRLVRLRGETVEIF